MTKQIPASVIDELMDMYVKWKEACETLQAAYEQWSSVRVAERESAFAEYRAALDWEELASACYADRVALAGRELPHPRSRVVA